MCLPWGCAHSLDQKIIVSPTQKSADQTKIIAHSEDFVVLKADSGDNLRSLATQFCGDPSKDWVIAEFNDIDHVLEGQQIVVPHNNYKPYGIFMNGIRKVPILSYHRFSPNSHDCERLSISEDTFTNQMNYLKDNGFVVINFTELADFLEGRGNLPPKSVIISIDDGFKSVYEIAFPILKKFGFKATVFVYSDLVGVPSGLTWKQMEEMVASGFIDIQPHSKTHSDLSQRLDGEDEVSYRDRLRLEIVYPADLIRRKLGLAAHTFAYPYGMENDTVVETVLEAGYRLAVTVTRGGNPSFSHPYVLHRSQVYCDDPIDAYIKLLEVFEKVTWK
jgi:peptidoglycan/xylan/chitin deacetylase (PgdA/CDA1 family)